MRRFTVFVTIVIVFFCTWPAHAAAGDAEGSAGSDVEKVTQKLENLTAEIVSILEKKDMEEDRKQEEIMDLVEPMIDFDLMAKLTLGRRSWTRLSEKEQGEFIDLFVERLKSSYLEKTSLYSGQEVVYKEGFKKRGKLYVPMEVLSSDENAEVLYKFYHSGTGWKVYDVEVNGVSLVRSYRSQFDEILDRGSVKDLFEELGQAEEK